MFATYQSLPTDIVEKAIHATFQQEKNQQQEGLWIEVSKKHKPRPQKNKIGHVKQPCTMATPSQQQKFDAGTLQTTAFFRKKEKNRKKNENKRLKKKKAKENVASS